MGAERVEIITVEQRNGAWLISALHNEITVDMTPDQLYDCASGLGDARRIARETAEGWGYTGGPRWEETGRNHKHRGYRHTLLMFPPDSDGSDD